MTTEIKAGTWYEGADCCGTFCWKETPSKHFSHEPQHGFGIYRDGVWGGCVYLSREAAERAISTEYQRKLAECRRRSTGDWQDGRWHY